MGLESIIDWNMTPEESEVFQICLIYEQEFKKLFEKTTDGQIARINFLTNKKDPRKSSLFKYCWKLRRETRGLLEMNEYRHYIYANLYIIDQFKGRIAPNCITGDKAWIRYKLWKRHFDKKMDELGAKMSDNSENTTDPKIMTEIDRTKKFIFEKCNGETPTKNFIKTSVDNNFIKLWVAAGKISPYYIILSPYVAKICDINVILKSCPSSPEVYKSKITNNVINYFKKEFNYEFI